MKSLFRDLRIKILNGIKNFNFKAMSTKKKVLFVISTFLFVIFLFASGVYLYVRGMIYFPTQTTIQTEDGNKESYDDVDVEEPIYQEQKGITNILLIGTDGRTLKEQSRSDTIIIATIDDNNKKLKLTTIQRDTYVDIPKHKSQKINAAYAIGGAELLMKTIEVNFRMKIDKYIVVNFWGFEDIVDAVGGIDINVKDYEVDEVNKFIGETREVKSPPLEGPGYQHLDGQQALSYARIRKVGNGVYERNERQKEVLGILAGKLKGMNPIEYTKLMTKVLKCVKTNVEPMTLLNYAYTITKFQPLQVTQLQMPMEELSYGGSYKGSWVILMDKEQNAQVMADYIYMDKVTTKDDIDLKASQVAINKYLKPGSSSSSNKSTSNKSSNEEVKNQDQIEESGEVEQSTPVQETNKNTEEKADTSQSSESSKPASTTNGSSNSTTNTTTSNTTTNTTTTTNTNTTTNTSNSTSSSGTSSSTTQKDDSKTQTGDTKTETGSTSTENVNTESGSVSTETNTSSTGGNSNTPNQ